MVCGFRETFFPHPPKLDLLRALRVMSSLALDADGFVRCLCKEQSTGSSLWFNKLINKTCNYRLFQRMNEMNEICEKVQYALGIAEDPLDATCLSNATVPVCDRQGPQELCK